MLYADCHPSHFWGIRLSIEFGTRRRNQSGSADSGALNHVSRLRNRCQARPEMLRMVVRSPSIEVTTRAESGCLSNERMSEDCKARQSCIRIPAAKFTANSNTELETCLGMEFPALMGLARLNHAAERFSGMLSSSRNGKTILGKDDVSLWRNV